MRPSHNLRHKAFDQQRQMVRHSVSAFVMDHAINEFKMTFGLVPWSGSRDMVMINVQAGAQEGTAAVISCVRYVPALSTICTKKQMFFPFAVACSIACCCHIIQKPPPVCRTGPFSIVPERPFPSHVDLYEIMCSSH